MPGASVKAVEVATGFLRTTVTAGDGHYVFPNLRPTEYEVSAEASGFRGFKRSGLELLANQSLTLNIALEVGAVTETITVAGAALQVNTSTSTLSEVVDGSRIIEMPLNGRDVARLSNLVPGTALISVSSETGKSLPGGLQLSANGSRNQQVSYRLDGTNNTDPYFQENQSFPFPDAVQEFSIQTANYSAAQGNNAGAQVNVVTRSGTNELHGGAFEFVRNRVFNARSFFSPTQDFLKRNQFGAYGGGPVRLPGYNGRNKTFFFVGWQGTRIRNLANSLSAFAPTNDERAGNFSTCGSPCNRVLKDPLGGVFANNQIPVSRFDPAAVKVNSFIPAVGGDGFMVIPRPINWQQDQGVAKIDHQLTQKDRLSVRYFIDNFLNAGTYEPSNLLSYRNPTLTSSVRSQSAAVNWVRSITPTLLNEFHTGFNRLFAQRSPPGGVPSMQTFGVRLPIYPTKPSISQIEPSGFFNIGDNLEGKFPRSGFEWGNRTSWIHGRHTISFGGEAQRVRAGIINEYRRAGHFVFSGDATGMAMSDYFLGAIRTFDQGTGEYKDFRATYPALYFQDDIKVSRRVTLNLGVRYESGPPYEEIHKRIEVFSIEDYQARYKSPLFTNSAIGEKFVGDPGVNKYGTEADYNNWAARLGFAWDIFGDGRTSLRGGAGMFYDQHQNGEFNNGAVDASPWSIRESITTPQGPFSDPYRGRTDFNAVAVESIGAKDAAFPKPILISTFDPRQETPLIYNWNLTFEREVVPEWLLRAAYVGSASNYGRTSKQFNPAVYTPGSTAGTDARRLFAAGNIGSVDYYTQDRRSRYNSAQISLTKRFSHGFTVLTNYTWSKSMDDQGDYVEPWYFPNGDAMQWGPSDFDHKHRFVISAVWELPKVPTSSGFVRQAFHGWELTALSQNQSGAPFNMKSGRDNSLAGLGNDRPKLTGTAVAPAAGLDKRVWFNSAAFAVNDTGTFGTLGRNAFYGPQSHSWDVGLFKMFKITERVNTQFRAEFFNLFNQVNFANPNTTVTGGGFGTITKTNDIGGDPRIIQFSLKLAF